MEVVRNRPISQYRGLEYTVNMNFPSKSYGVSTTANIGTPAMEVARNSAILQSRGLEYTVNLIFPLKSYGVSTIVNI